MLYRITPHYQGKTRFCSIFAVIHALMVEFSTRENKEQKINPWRAVLTVFRYKNWPFLSNRSFSPHEVVAAFKRYGIKIGDYRWRPQKVVEVAIKDIDGLLAQGKPIIATLNDSHEVTVVDKMKLWTGVDAYEIIDSSSKKHPYRLLRSPKLSNFYQII